MWHPRTNQEGLSQRVNRVALPTMDSLEDVYKELPPGLDLGFIGELEVPRMKAVLCKTAIDIPRRSLNEALTRQAVEDSHFEVKAGSREITFVDTNVPADRFKGGKLWLWDGTGQKRHPLAFSDDTYIDNGTHGNFRVFPIESNTASATVRTVANIVVVTLENAIPEDIPASSGIILESNMFNNTSTASTTATNKVIGVNLVTVPVDYYYWAVFQGDVIGDADKVIAKNAPLAKAGNGEVAEITTATEERIGFAKVAAAANAACLMTLDIQGIEGAAA